jgi:AraC-like DNA-binding protein
MERQSRVGGTVVKSRLEPIEGAWNSFIVEFPSYPRQRRGDQEALQKILFLCAAPEKNPAELCFAFFGPQILLHPVVNGDGADRTEGSRLIFVYAAEIPADFKASLELVQDRYNAPVLVAQRANVQKSAQHVLEFLQGSAGSAHGSQPHAAGHHVAGPDSQGATLEAGLAPLPTDVSLWDGALPQVVLEHGGEHGETVTATVEIQDYRAEYACRYVLQNYKENINRDRMAEMVSLSPGYFSNLFRVETGMSFSDYLIQIRIDNAKRLLRRFDLSVEEVSKECGFNSLAHFSRTFKDRCGVPPLKYRKTPNHEASNHEAPAGETADLKVMGQAS